MKVISGYEPFEFQRDSVTKLLDVVNMYGGCCIFDQTGLGKTITSATLAINLHDDPKILVISPTANKSSWVNIFSLANVKSATVCTAHKIEVSSYDIVIVDEAHNFRNITAKSYLNLFSVIHKRSIKPKVILLSATPFNNNFTELKTIFSLIPFKSNTLPYFKLGSLFNDIEATEKKLSIFDRFGLKWQSFQSIGEHVSLTLLLGAHIKDLKKVVNLFSIRNTRTNIKENYPNDLDVMGTFPKLTLNDKIEYSFNRDVYLLMDRTLKTIEGMPLVKQNIIQYCVTEFNTETLTGMNGLYTCFLFKRLDSSITAFKETLSNSYNKLLELKQYEGMNKITLNKKELTLKDPDVFWCDVNSDIIGFESLINLWAEITDAQKVELLLNRVNEWDGKIVIFTEFNATLDLIVKNLRDNNIKFIQYNAKTDSKVLDEIQYEFDANEPVAEQKNKVKVLVCSDVLAEGINLHRATKVIHFDSKWNPAKITQRNGRIDRIYVGKDKKTKSIEVDIFSVDSFVDRIIELENKISHKSSQSENFIDFENSKFENHDRFKWFEHGKTLAMISNGSSSVNTIIRCADFDISKGSTLIATFSGENKQYYPINSEFNENKFYSVNTTKHRIEKYRNNKTDLIRHLVSGESNTDFIFNPLYSKTIVELYPNKGLNKDTFEYIKEDIKHYLTSNEPVEFCFVQSGKGGVIYEGDVISEHPIN